MLHLDLLFLSYIPHANVSTAGACARTVEHTPIYLQVH